MKEYWLIEIPTQRQINTAVHQGDGLVVETVDGQLFAFVPRSSVKSELNSRTIGGSYTQIADNRFTEIDGEGNLIISDITTPEPSARLVLLDRD